MANKTAYKGGDYPLPAPEGDLVGRQFRPWRPYLFEGMRHSGSTEPYEKRSWYTVLRTEEHPKHGLQLVFLNDRNEEMQLHVNNVGEWKEV